MAKLGAPRRGTGEAVGIRQPEKQPGTLTHRSGCHYPRATRPVSVRTVPTQVAQSKPPSQEEQVTHTPGGAALPAHQADGDRPGEETSSRWSEPHRLHFDCPPAPSAQLPTWHCIFPFLPPFKLLHTFPDHLLSYLKTVVISH